MTNHQPTPKKSKWYLKTDSNGDQRLNLDRILLVSLMLIVVLFFGITLLIFVIPFHFESARLMPNEIGETFGVANALFSSLAFAFLIYTSLLQREELRLQREEIKENREELKRSADAQKALVDVTRMMNKDLFNPVWSVSSYAVGVKEFVFMLYETAVNYKLVEIQHAETEQKISLTNPDVNFVISNKVSGRVYRVNLGSFEEYSSKTKSIKVRLKLIFEIDDGRKFYQFMTVELTNKKGHLVILEPKSYLFSK